MSNRLPEQTLPDFARVFHQKFLKVAKLTKAI